MERDLSRSCPVRDPTLRPREHASTICLLMRTVSNSKQSLPSHRRNRLMAISVIFALSITISFDKSLLKPRQWPLRAHVLTRAVTRQPWLSPSRLERHDKAAEVMGDDGTATLLPTADPVFLQCFCNIHSFQNTLQDTETRMKRFNFWFLLHKFYCVLVD
jgi:hypothetical protein